MGFLSDIGSFLGDAAKGVGSVLSLSNPVLGASIGAGGSILSSQSSRLDQKDLNAQNLAFAREQMQYQSEEADKARSWQEKMWNEQNRYNSPSNQLKLMREAGINPNLFDTSVIGASSAGSSPSPSSIGAPSLVNPSMSSKMSSITSALELSIQQEDLRRKQLENRDLENEIKAREELHNGDIYVLDTRDGLTFSVETSPDMNYYQFMTKEQRNRVKNQDYELRKQTYSLRDLQIMSDILKENQDIISRMDVHKLLQLQEDVRSKKLNNSVLEDEVKLLKEYGISSRDSNSFVTLIRSALRNPDGLSKALDALIDASLRTGQHIGTLVTDLINNVPKVQGSW